MVTREGEVLFDQSFESERSHNSQMFAPLKAALAEHGDNLDLLVVGTGPGSYTGARIGIAAIQAVSWSRNVPVIGLPSLLAVTGADYVVCGDARRGAFYAAEISGGKLVSDSIVMSLEAVTARRQALAELAWYSFDSKSPAHLEDVKLVTPDAIQLARQATALTAEELADYKNKPLEPFYLSAPFVTQSKRPFSVA